MCGRGAPAFERIGVTRTVEGTAEVVQASQGSATSQGEDGAAELLRNVFADPDGALARARALLTTTQDPAVLSIARQVIGIVLRDRGEMAPALAELRHALRLARTAGEPSEWRT